MNTNFLSIIVPVLNEEGSINQLYEELAKALSSDFCYEIIFIDDGSIDSSFKIISAIYNKDPNHVRFIRFRKNFGKASAYSAGFEKAKGDVIVTIDADLQDIPSEIPKLISEIEQGYDVVTGWKKDRKDSFLTVVASRFFNSITSFVMKKKIHDINCGLKAYKSTVIDEIKIYGDLYRFIPLLALDAGFRITEIPVSHTARTHGKSKYGWKRFISGFVDIFTVVFITRYRTKPSHFFGVAGFVFFSIGFVSDAYVTVLKIFTGTTQGKIPLLLFGMLFMIIGIQLLSLGLLGEYILASNKRHRTYTTRESSYH